MFVCFVCVILIANAGSQTDSDFVDPQTTTDASSETTIFGILMALSASFVYAASCISNRSLSDFPYQLIMFWGSLLAIPIWVSCCLFNFALSGSALTIFSLSASTWWMLLAAIAFDILATNAMTIAFQSGSSGFICLIGYLSIVYAFLSDLIIFNATFSVTEIVASTTIVLAVVAVTIFKVGLSSKKKPA